MEGNYIKINRKMLEWEWYRNINVKVLFLHMLLKANWKDGKLEGITIPRGSFVSSVKTLSEETRLSEQQIKTAIKKLKDTGEITSKATNKYTVITVVKYDEYQTNNQQITNEQPSNNKQITTIEEGKKERIKEYKNTSCKAEASALFERLWKLYPSKRGKGQVSESKKKQILDIGFEEMERTINRYKADLEKETWRKPQNGSTFFNSGYMDYLDANYVPSKGNTQAKKNNTFNNFDQREYDFKDLERKLLGR